MTVLTATEREVAGTFRDFAQTYVAPGALERDLTGAFPYDLVPRLADIGVFAIVVSQAHGGHAAPAVRHVLALEEIARRADQSVAALVANQVGLSALPIVVFGTPEQQRRWLPPLYAGEVLGALGLTEPGAGSDERDHHTDASGRRRVGAGRVEDVHHKRGYRPDGVRHRGSGHGNSPEQVAPSASRGGGRRGRQGA